MEGVGVAGGDMELSSLTPNPNPTGRASTHGKRNKQIYLTTRPYLIAFGNNRGLPCFGGGKGFADILSCCCCCKDAPRCPPETSREDVESLLFRLCFCVHDTVEVPLDSGGALGFCRSKRSIPHWVRAASVAGFGCSLSPDEDTVVATK